ncbi:hypothetical protein [Methylobacterium haplocladii]|uniref:hypothetical protein n=1 Tax=Methylobacterium haplocladii TaxID=1176176 RepID=UPI0011BE0122|nr:hypothetical protein [Methylobacterium haplocladii]GJD82400.1 hypothetical protein HPGCJGGD_0254 [Methylobacterium haplocladii]
MTSEDHRPGRSENDRALRIVQRIADALGIPAEAFLANAAPGSWSEPTARVGDDMAEREPGAAEEYRSRTLPAPATKNPDREWQAAEMQALFDRVFELAEREACLSFVRARGVG